MDFSAQKGLMNQPVNEMWMLTSCSPPWTPSLTLQVPEDRLWFNEIQTYSCNQHPHNQLKFGRFVGISFDYLLEPGFSGRLVIFDCNSWRSRCWEHLINQGMFFNCSRTKSKNSVFFETEIVCRNIPNSCVTLDWYMWMNYLTNLGFSEKKVGFP